jgi:hypothetical protein
LITAPEVWRKTVPPRERTLPALVALTLRLPAAIAAPEAMARNRAKDRRWQRMWHALDMGFSSSSR